MCELVGGGILDFLEGDRYAAEGVVTWSPQLWQLLRDLANDLLRGQPVTGLATRGLVRVGLVNPAGIATEFGRVLAYHLAETGWQNRGDLLRQLVVEMAGLGDESRVLDVGCGAGTTLHHLADQRPRVRAGVDCDLVALAVGHRLYGDEDLALARADAGALPFADGTFTHVLSRVTLNYLAQQKGLSEMVRVLAPGGWLALRFEAAGYDLIELKRARGLKARLAKARGLVAGLILQTTGIQVSLGRSAGARNYASSFRLGRMLRRLGCDVKHVEEVTRSPRCLGCSSQKVLLARRAG